MKPDNCGCYRPPSSETTDRYVSFTGIDCTGNARRLMQMIDLLSSGAAKDDPFLAYFHKKRTPPSGSPPDDLFLIHSNINQIRDLFENYADQPALLLLQQIEEECC